jgi:hypothetical protein
MSPGWTRADRAFQGAVSMQVMFEDERECDDFAFQRKKSLRQKVTFFRQKVNFLLFACNHMVSHLHLVD